MGEWFNIKRALIILAGLLIAVTAALAAYLLFFNSAGGTLTGPEGSAFTIQYRDNWHALDREEVERIDPSLLAVLKRNNGKGTITVREEGRADKDYEKYSRELAGELSRRIPDFKQVSAHTVKLRSGGAFFYSYISERSGDVTTIVLVPDGDRSFVINSSSSGGDDQTAEEIGKMIRSFQIPSKDGGS